MAAPSTAPGVIFAPTGREIIKHFIVPKALRGELSNDIVEGVDVFSVSPDALPFRHRTQKYREKCGYFLAVQPAGERCLAPGGCWVRYNREKAYYDRDGAEAVGFRRRFAFHITPHGGRIQSRTVWLMEEYRLNKDASASASAYGSSQANPQANLDFVIRKIFRKPKVPTSSPAYSSDESFDGSSAGEEVGFDNFSEGEEEGFDNSSTDEDGSSCSSVQVVPSMSPA